MNNGVPTSGMLQGGLDMRSLRQFKATAKAAGGVLDLIMPMRAGSDGPALFFAHPLIGLSWCYLALLPHMDARFPLYGLQARGIRRPEPLPTSMAEMARDYADQIRKVQPAGPYHLLGWSLGGNIAFAIAEELQGRGEEIGLLTILDSNMTDFEIVPATNAPQRIYNLVLAQFGYVPALTADEPEPEERMLEMIRRRPGMLGEWPDARLRSLQRVIRNNIAVSCTQRPGRVRSRLLFVAASRNPPTLAEKLQAWGSFVDGPIEVVEVDCEHSLMLLPEPVARIGPALSAQLAAGGLTTRS